MTKTNNELKLEQTQLDGRTGRVRESVNEIIGLCFVYYVKPVISPPITKNNNSLKNMMSITILYWNANLN